MISWNKTAENPPPKDRLILVTSGIAWRREDEDIPAFIHKDRVIREAYTRSRVTEIGGACLVFWKEKEDQWVEFGRGCAFTVPFEYWTEYENPIDKSYPNSYHGTHVPDVEEMAVYEPTEEELESRKLFKMIFGR